MDEADIRLHLAKQTKLSVELVDLLKLQAARASTQHGKSKTIGSAGNGNGHGFSRTKQQPAIVLYDTFDPADLPVIGQMISHQVPAGGQLFSVGSSGIEYALVAFWREQGLLENPREIAPAGRPAAAPQIITVSGSCSPVTDRQIGRALDAGFVEIACDSRMLADARQTVATVKETVARAQPALEAGRNVIFHTARGPADHRRAGFERAARRSAGASKAERLAAAGANLGQGLALILHYAMRGTGARRAVVCGGDTSTHVARALGIEALEFIAPMAPGGPLCRIHAPSTATDGLEIIFKGGQVGRDTFFLDVANRGIN